MLYLHLPTVVAISTAVMLLVSVMTVLFGQSQRVYRGFQWWAAAQWLATLGLALQWGSSWLPWALPVAALLMLQWPVLVLLGLRRFFRRLKLPGSVGSDMVLLALFSTLWVGVWASPSDAAWNPVALAMALGLLHLYAAWVLMAIPRETAPLSTLGLLQGAMLTAGGLQLAAVAVHGLNLGMPTPPPMIGIVVTLTLNALVTLMLCMILTHDRTAQSLRDSQVQLRVLANMDTLTNMPNRRHFRELADRMIARSPLPPAVMLFDIDHFKQVNDRHGHAVGDEALRIVALSARQTFRTQDIVGRLGGDEFVALMPSTSMEDALRVADRMVRQAAATRLEHPEVPRLGLSFGVARMAPQESFEAALKRADEALYEAKRQGRCRAVATRTESGQAVFAESRALGLGPI